MCIVKQDMRDCASKEKGNLRQPEIQKIASSPIYVDATFAACIATDATRGLKTVPFRS